MRVLMTADTVGGVWTYATELARALAERNVDVVLATMGAPLSAAQRAQAAAVPGLLVEQSTYRLEWMEDPWADVDRAGAWLLELERAHRPDLVHVNGYAHGSLDWSAPALVVGHSCVRSWHEAVRRAPAGGEWSEYTRRVADGLRAADAVVAPSRYMRDALLRHYGALRDVRVIYNARRADEFAPAAKEEIIVAAGRVWDEAKNLAVLDVIARDVAWPIHIAGAATSPDGQTYASQSAHLLGVLAPDALAAWLGRAAVFAHPARYEPFGLSGLEAALAGCALVLGDIPSLRELWDGAAVFVDPDDAHGIATAIDGLCRAPARRVSLAARARARARRFTPARMADAYLQVYDELQARAATAVEVIACAS
ncbi:MAG TPA: glycosyltransferase family 4 protein [Gemmatimonadaceae bacterium]|nr:glycosyltransferase family 4 protein [Gemmatimonadaceae bacterium]